MKKRTLSLVLAAAMTASLFGCSKTETPTATTAEPAGTTAQAEETTAAPAEQEEDTYTIYERTGDHDADSEALYQAALGDFYELYMEAKEITEPNERYAKMAIAEAKLLEAGTFTPTTAQGGYYALRRFAPYTNSSVTWGTDSDRFHNRVVTNEIVAKEDYLELKSMWAELRGTGTYEAKAKEFLTGKGYTLSDSLTIGYTSDPTTWDAFTTFLASNTEATVNTVDGLMEYNGENDLVPALAESYTVSEDGLTYTFKLREGVMWVDSQGREIAELTSDDFLAGMQHFLDGGSGAEYLAGESGARIVNADEYYEGEKEFSEVGVKAVDKYTVEYTLNGPCSFFMTLLSYTTFQPLCRSYYESQGGKFGADYDAAATQYGVDPDHIAYCGPYVVTSATANNSIVFAANKAYWNAENINIKTLTWLFNDGTDPTKGYNDFLAGTISGVSLTSSTLEIAKNDGNFDKYAVPSDTDATAFVIFTNLNRQSYANYNDTTKVVSTKTEDQNAVTYAAMNNVHFRRALACGLDRVTYNAQTTSEDLAAMSLINSYVKGTFVALSEDTTVSINGTDTTFPAGTWYGEIIQAQLDADEVPIKAFDKDADGGVGSGSGYDGWYNLEYAQSELELAVEQLKANGVEITAENPVVIDYPVYTASEIYANKGQAYKQSIETNLKGLVQINIVECVDIYDWYYTQYFSRTAEDMNFDIGDISGWSPDFGDPSTFLETMMPDYIGYCTASIGLY